MIRFFLGLFLCMALAVPAIAAEPAAAPRIAVVDVVVLMRESKAAKSLEAQVEAKRKTYRAEIAAEEKKLRAEEDALVKDKATLSAEDFAARRKAFEGKLRALQKSAQSKRAGLEQGSAKSIGRLQTEITKLTAEMATERKIDLVLTRDQVVIVGKEFDITDAVMDKLNSALPDIKLITQDKN